MLPATRAAVMTGLKQNDDKSSTLVQLVSAWQKALQFSTLGFTEPEPQSIATTRVPAVSLSNQHSAVHNAQHCMCGSTPFYHTFITCSVLHSIHSNDPSLHGYAYAARATSNTCLVTHAYVCILTWHRAMRLLLQACRNNEIRQCHAEQHDKDVCAPHHAASTGT